MQSQLDDFHCISAFFNGVPCVNLSGAVANPFTWKRIFDGERKISINHRAKYTSNPRKTYVWKFRVDQNRLNPFLGGVKIHQEHQGVDSKRSRSPPKGKNMVIS